MRRLPKVNPGNLPLPLLGAVIAATVGVLAGIGLLLDGISTGILTKALVVVAAVFVVIARLGGGLAAAAAVFGWVKAWKVWAPTLGPLVLVAAVPRSWFVAGVVFAVAMLAGVAGGYGWSLRPRFEPIGGKADTTAAPVEATPEGGAEWWTSLQGRARAHWKRSPATMH